MAVSPLAADWLDGQNFGEPARGSPRAVPRCRLDVAPLAAVGAAFAALSRCLVRGRCLAFLGFFLIG
jgi:hypothetical protein